MSEQGVKSIQRLDEVVVNRIAAGEIIHRPHSALKELIENSLDAGSTSISVIVKNGGLKMLQITDNGHGIKTEDFGIVCERFTTSKLVEFDDLQKIATFGFRGEALASISHVAHVTITSMTPGAECAFKQSYADGKPVSATVGGKAEPKPCAGIQGTQILVEDLFFNAPTRRKALKSPSDEFHAISDVVSKYAINNPGVSFSLKKHGEGRTAVHTATNASVLDNIRVIYGSKVAKELLPVDLTDDQLQVTVTGFTSNANYSVKKTTFLLFINKRLVTCNNMKRALEAVYSPLLPNGGHPFMYLSLMIPPESVDVNVHPTKREVHFLNEEEIVKCLEDKFEEVLAGANNSRTFYTQGALPQWGITVNGDEPLSPSKSHSKEKEGSAPQYDYKMVRVNQTNKAGQLDAFVNKSSGKRSLGQTVSVIGLVSLRNQVKENTHKSLSELIKHHVFVGAVDASLALVQYQTKLFLVNTTRFGNFGCFELSSPLSVKELLLIGLDAPESGWTEADGDKETIAKYINDLLTSKKDMLKEYFGMTIDEEGRLAALPQLVEQYIPSLERLPMFLLRLGTEVDWENEQACFDSLAKELADFYSVTSSNLHKENSHGIKWVVQHLIYPTMRMVLDVPQECAKDGTIIQVAALEKLYRVFERC